MHERPHLGLVGERVEELAGLAGRITGRGIHRSFRRLLLTGLPRCLLVLRLCLIGISLEFAILRGIGLLGLILTRILRRLLLAGFALAGFGLVRGIFRVGVFPFPFFGILR